MVVGTIFAILCRQNLWIVIVPVEASIPATSGAEVVVDL
jgi:hypothetical protein